MAWNQDDLDAIDKAIKTGVSTVKYTDRSVEYRSLADLMRIRDLARRELGLLASGDANRVYPSFSKGLKP